MPTEVPSDSSFLTIDKERLDSACLEQPHLVYEYSTKLAHVRAELDEAKAELDITEAEVAKDIRDNPRKYGFEKEARLTVDATKNATRETREYQIATKRVNKLKHTVDMLFAAVTALDHRKKMLESLVHLHGQQYFASPRLSTEDRGRMDEDTKRTVEKRILGKLNKKEE